MTAAALLLVFSASVMGSFHCAAMCGGFSLGLVRPGQTQSSLLRLSAYHFGKLFTYVFIGGVAGVLGAALIENAVVRAAQAAFAAVAGSLIVVVGLQTLGLAPGQNIVNRIASRLWLGPFLGPIFQTFRQRDSLDGAFFLGLFNGFLPCGFVYTFALTAAGSGSFTAALLVMLAFGLGTAPMLLAVAWGGAAASRQGALRPMLARAAGVLVIALGLITAFRGIPLFPALASHADHSSHSAVDLEPAPAPPFTLTDQNGRLVSLQNYRGKVVVMNFIYTSCTTSCPLLTATFRAVQNGLDSNLRDSTVLLSITVDPATDTPAVLKAFGEKWQADFGNWVFLTGDPVSIDSAAAQYAVFVARAENGVAHTETILLIDGQSQLRSVFGLRADPQTIIEKVRELAREL